MLEVNATLQGFSRIDFDKKKIRKALRAEGGIIRKDARKMVARRAIASAVGEYPARQTGALMRSIKVKVSRPGFLVKIAPQKTADMSMFYPAVIGHGSIKRNIQARKNYMEDALNNRRAQAQAAILNALQDALIPRK